MSSLLKLNADPHDSRLRKEICKELSEKYDYYLINNNNNHDDIKLTHVTDIVASHFPKFNDDNVINKMKKSAYWKSSKYYGMTDQEIKDQWKTKRDQAADLGTRLHIAISDFIDYEIHSDDLDIGTEFEYFKNYLSDLLTVELSFNRYRVDWEIYSEEHKIIGKPNLILSNSRNDIKIIHFTRSKTISKSNPFSSAFEPISHMDDCNFNIFSLKLNLYRKILESCYNKHVVSINLVVCHPDNSKYDIYDIPFLEKETDIIWNNLPTYSLTPLERMEDAIIVKSE